MHHVAEALAEPAVRKVQPSPDAHDGGGIDEGHSRDEEGGQSRGPSRRECPVMVAKVDLQGRLEDVTSQQNDADPPMLMSRMLFGLLLMLLLMDRNLLHVRSHDGERIVNRTRQQDPTRRHEREKKKSCFTFQD